LRYLRCELDAPVCSMRRHPGIRHGPIGVSAEVFAP
jgi:hypothetical protein